VSKNPARTFALVNIALIVGAAAAIFWFQAQGVLDLPGHQEPVRLVDSTRGATADTLSIQDVQPASAAQVRFIRELLADTSEVVRHAFTVRAPHRDDAHYLGAEIGRADTAHVPIALWIVTGPRDRPQSIQALNEAAERSSVARPSAQTERRAAAAAEATRILAQRLDAASR